MTWKESVKEWLTFCRNVILSIGIVLGVTGIIAGFIVGFSMDLVYQILITLSAISGIIIMVGTSLKLLLPITGYP